MTVISQPPDPLAALRFHLHGGGLVRQQPPVRIVGAIPVHPYLAAFAGRILRWKHGVVSVITGTPRQTEQGQEWQSKNHNTSGDRRTRSEERRVGKEGRARWSRCC